MKFIRLLLRNHSAGLNLHLALRCAILRRAADALAQRMLNAKAKSARGGRQHAEALRILREAAAIRAAENLSADAIAASTKTTSQKERHVAP